MTVIRPNSISGVSSITGQGGDISIFRADGTAGDVTVNNITSGVITATTFSGNLSGGTINATSGTITGNLGVGGVLTYEDVTNIDSVGVITARSTVSIADSIVHTGDTNTSLRFPAADTITAETGGLERIRVDSSGRLGVGANNNDSYDTNARNVLIASSGNTGITIRSGGSSNYAMIHFADGTTGAALQRAGRIVYEHSTDSLQVSTANTFAFKIDSNGAITKPKTPTFAAQGSGDAISAQSPLPYDSILYNNGCHYNNSTYKFNITVNGYYYVTCHVVPTNFTTPNNVELYIKDDQGNRFFLDRKVKSNNYSTNNFSVGGSRILYKTAGADLWVELNSINGSPTLESSSHFGIMLMA